MELLPEMSTTDYLVYAAAIAAAVGLDAASAAPSNEQQFIAGFEAAGGDPQQANYMAYVVAPCESTSNPNAVSLTGYLGFVQFSPVTWYNLASQTGYSDWTSPFQQGFNSAVLITQATPESQWSCYAI